MRLTSERPIPAPALSGAAVKTLEDKAERLVADATAAVAHG
jgi:hypothetical protein